MPALDDLKEFDIANSTVSLWVVRQNGKDGNGDTRYTARWASIDAALEQRLKEVSTSQRETIEELQDYSILAQNNEGSALHISADETEAVRIRGYVSDAVANRQARSHQDLVNSKFYIIKMVNDGVTLLAFKKLLPSWSAKKRRNLISIAFHNHELTVQQDETFDIYNTVDFFMMGDDIMMRSKVNFESILNYKAAHQEEAVQLFEEQTFIDIFSDVGDITAFVGNNKIQLRRIHAIKTKGHYRVAGFMTNLQQRCAALGFRFTFNDQGKIVPGPEGCADVITALLDHRLTSQLSDTTYDVQSTSAVG